MAVVVFGSLNVDIVMNPTCMPQPGETVLCPSYTLYPGGKGANQALAARRAGADVYMIGTVGEDAFADIAVSYLKQDKVNLDYLQRSSLATGCASICVDGSGENMIIVASGANCEARCHHVPGDLLSKENTLLLQMETPAQENWALIQRARQKGMRIILNLAPAQKLPKDTIAHVDLLILNEGEAMALAKDLGLVHSHSANLEDLKAISEAIVHQFRLTIIITRGKYGVICSTTDNFWEVPSTEVDVIDTTAAGDAFVGILAAYLDQGHGLYEALGLANIGAGLACTQQGAQSSLPYQEGILKNNRT